MTRNARIYPAPAHRRIKTATLALGLCLTLTGCFEQLFFEPDYSLSGLPAHKNASQDIEGYFKDEVSTVTLPENKKDREAAALQASETLRQNMTEKMLSLGYYDATVGFAQGKDIWAGNFTINAGERYKISQVTVKGATKDAKDQDSLTPLYALKHLPLDAQTVLDTKDDVQRRLDRRSCRYGNTLTHTAVIDRRNKTAALEFELKQGPKAKLGAVAYSGQKTVNESYLQKSVPWREGDCYQQQQVENLRGKLFESGLFSGVDIIMPKNPNRDGSVDVDVKLTERPHRSFSAGATYYSDEGPGLTLGWKHRNLLGGAELLDASLKMSGLEQSLGATLTSPYFLRKDQKLTFKAEMKNEDTDAYQSKSLSTGATISRSINRNLTLGAGVRFTFSRITDNLTLNEEDFGLVSFPLTAAYDTRNNPLDSTRGWFIEADAEPYINTLGSAAPFVKASATVRKYQKLNDDNVIAARAKIGSIQGATLADVPADERFYVGGSGSVRGFAYQTIGPQRAGDPTGGRGMVEGSVELRHKFTEDIGGVAFVDAGSLTEESTPDFSDTSIGAGLGLRYYTAVGPIRFDVATPLTNDEQTADQVQFYVSLGQAF